MSFNLCYHGLFWLHPHYIWMQCILMFGLHRCLIREWIVHLSRIFFMIPLNPLKKTVAPLQKKDPGGGVGSTSRGWRWVGLGIRGWRRVGLVRALNSHALGVRHTHFNPFTPHLVFLTKRNFQDNTHKVAPLLEESSEFPIEVRTRRPCHAPANQIKKYSYRTANQKIALLYPGKI